MLRCPRCAGAVYATIRIPVAVTVRVDRSGQLTYGRAVQHAARVAELARQQPPPGPDTPVRCASSLCSWSGLAGELTQTDRDDNATGS